MHAQCNDFDTKLQRKAIAGNYAGEMQANSQPKTSHKKSTCNMCRNCHSCAMQKMQLQSEQCHTWAALSNTASVDMLLSVANNMLKQCTCTCALTICFDQENQSDTMTRIPQREYLKCMHEIICYRCQSITANSHWSTQHTIKNIRTTTRPTRASQTNDNDKSPH